VASERGRADYFEQAFEDAGGVLASWGGSQD
jgi:hypothetical protein